MIPAFTLIASQPQWVHVLLRSQPDQASPAPGRQGGADLKRNRITSSIRMVEASLKRYKSAAVFSGGQRRAQWPPRKSAWIHDTAKPPLHALAPLACRVLVQRHLFGRGLERLGQAREELKCGPAVVKCVGGVFGEE
jgi:hypothetical protein